MAPRRGGIALRRVCATAVDYLLVVAYIGMITVVALIVRISGLVGPAPSPEAYRWIGQAVLFATLTVPVVIWLAWWEAAPRGATPGKRLLGLRVEVAAHGRPLGFGQALVRNALKVALPWELAHTAVWRLRAWPAVPEDPVAWALLAAAYLLAFWYVLALFLGRRHAPYDGLTNTRVTAVEPRL